MNLDENWDEFIHEVVEQPTAEAEINDEGIVYVQVSLKVRHWNEKKGFLKKLAQPHTHTMGFMVPVKEMWVIAEGCETPHKMCRGRDCGKPEITDDQT